MAIEVKTLNNGPYMVSGDIGELDLRDGAGNPHDLSGKKQVYLCRCGGSTNKPFCDGQHSKIGFQAAEAAVSAQG
jgi:3-phenylpropionate/trans-cinnamate dioxygenase ferredoxin subunit